jgi:hypothetical protein
METRVAVAENEVKNLWKRLEDHIQDFRNLRGTWTMVTITIVGFLFVIIGVTANGFSSVADSQSALMKEQVEIKADMKSIKESLVSINESMATITKEHASLHIEK